MPGGRPPKPTVLKVLQGNPGKRPLNTNEPKPQPIAPKPPSWLPREAKREWKRLAPELEKLGLLTIVDGTAFANYCLAYARLREAEETIKREGMVITTEKGYKMPHPAVKIAEKAQQIIKAFCSEFGLTPSSRSRMSLPGKNEDDEYEEFRRRGKATGA